MSRYAQFSAAIHRAQARVAQLRREIEACRADPIKAQHKRNELRRAESDLAWLRGQLDRLDTAEG